MGFGVTRRFAPVLTHKDANGWMRISKPFRLSEGPVVGYSGP
jgi:hypothetical protein